MKELTIWSDEQFKKMREEMDRLFRDFFSDYAAPGLEELEVNQPRIEVREEEAALLIRLDFPAFEPEDLEVAVEPESVVVEACHRDKLVEGKHRVQRSQSYSRRIKLPCRVDPERAEAVWLDHRLEIRLPRSTGAVSRRIVPRRGRQ